MLSKDDKRKVTIMAAIRGGGTDDEILDEFHITSNTLTAIKVAYETIKSQLEEMSSTSEIAGNLDCSEEFIEEVKHLIETGEEIPVKESEDALERDDGETKRTKGKKGGKAKDIDKNLKKAGEEQTASVLVDDAGDIAKGVAIQRQDIGKFVMEIMGTVAMQFGYKDLKQFLKDEVFEFWLKNQGRVREMDILIEELSVTNQQLQEAIELDMIGLFIAKSLDRVTVASLIGGGDLDPDKLFAYKTVLASDPVFIKQLYDAIHGIPQKSGEIKEGEVEAYGS